MDVIEAIKTRRSIRAYKPDPVPQAVVEQILEVARWAPSSNNTQPWEFAVITGQVLQEVLQRYVELSDAGVPPNPDLPSQRPPDLYRQRARTLGLALFECLGISLDDMERRQEHARNMTRLFGAPVGIVIYVDAALTGLFQVDVGSVMQTIMLAAHAHGLGTCALGALVRYPDELRKVLELPETKKIIIGIGLGYPDGNHPGAQFRSTRESLESMVKWYGFD